MSPSWAAQHPRGSSSSFLWLILGTRATFPVMRQEAYGCSPVPVTSRRAELEELARNPAGSIPWVSRGAGARRVIATCPACQIPSAECCPPGPSRATPAPAAESQQGYSLSKPRAKLGSGHLPFAPDLTPLSPSWGMEKLKLNGLDRQEGLKCPPYSPFFFQFLGREPAKDCEFQMTYRHERTSGITLVFLEIISEKSQPLLLLWDLPDRSNRMILLVTHICS